jgi:outer membrane protein TolC
VLTLDEVLRRVEDNYPKVLGAEAERAAAEAKRVSKAGAFDPVAVSGADFLRYNSTSTRGKEVTTTMSDVGVEIPTRSGLKLMTGRRLNVGAVKSPASSTGDFGEWYVGAKMPLARGLGINDKAAQERQAILGIPLADQNVALTALNAKLNAAVAYWDWVAAARRFTVAADLLRIAEVRAEGIDREVEKGARPKIDSVEAASEVERRRGSLVKARRDVEKAAFKLSLYLWDGNGEPAPPPPAEAAPAADPAAAAPAALAPEDVTAGEQRALGARPELRQIEINREIVRVDERLARNDRRPAVDLVYSPGFDGGANGIGETMKMGVAFSLPLYQRDARGRLEEARQKQRKLDQERELTAQTVRTEVADAASAVRRAAERYEAGVREVTALRRLEQAERDLLAAGLSDLFRVNLRERTTAEAAQRLIDVYAEYEQARAAFRAATVQL